MRNYWKAPSAGGWKLLCGRVNNAKQTGYHFDFRLPGEDPGHPRIMQARTSVIQGKSGEETCIVTVMHDVTDEREVDRMKTEFISTAAHELRTPLTSIRGFSEILLTRDDIKTEEKKKFLSYINKQSLNLANIIADLLDISRIESSLGFSLKEVPCNIADIIKGVVPYFQEQSPRHTFKVVLPEESVEVMVDEEKIGQVLENILSNAVKYSPQGGVIRVTGGLTMSDFRSRNAEQPETEKSVQSQFRIPKSTMEYRVSIQDQGIGMTRGQVTRIFDKFYRADSSGAGVPGTGLGMSIVKNLVEAHGGKVWVESKMAKGTTVRFTIPIKDCGMRRKLEILKQSEILSNKGGAEG
jgi:signal transduction histidine kinase